MRIRLFLTATAASLLLTAGLYAQARVGGGGLGGGIRGGGYGGGMRGFPSMRSSPALRGQSSAASMGSRGRGLPASAARIQPRATVGSSLAGRSTSWGLAPARAAIPHRAAAAREAGVAPGYVGSSRAIRGSSRFLGLRSESIPPLEQTGDARFRDFGRKGRFFGSRDFGGHFPVVVVPYGYADYGRYYTEPNIIVIDAGTRTESSTEYVVAVPPREPANPKLLELEPTEPKSQEATEEAEAVEAIEMVRPGQEAVAPTAPEEKPKPLIYLIALKSGVIHAARKHWLQNQALHYVTIQDEQKSAPLEEVDFDFTGQLNKERGVSFVVPVEIRSEEEKPEPEQKPEEEPEEEPVEK